MEFIFLWLDVWWKKGKSSVAEAGKERWRSWWGVMDEIREEGVASLCRAWRHSRVLWWRYWIYLSEMGNHLDTWREECLSLTSIKGSLWLLCKNKVEGDKGKSMEDLARSPSEMQRAFGSSNAAALRSSWMDMLPTRSWHNLLMERMWSVKERG